MKKILLLCGMIVALLTACSEQQTMESILDEEFVNIAKGYISASQAVDIANDFAADFNEEPGSRSESRKASSTRNVMTIRARASRSGDDLIYVVNYDDDQGFALVSKKDIENPVLAFIPEGSYDEQVASQIHGFEIFVSDAVIYLSNNLNIESEGTNDDISPTPTIPGLNDSIPQLRNSTYGHTVHLNWGQNGLFGSLCPNKTTGCVPLAYAMMMSYHEYPESIMVTYDNSNRVLHLNWKEIKCHKSYDLNRFGDWNSLRPYTNPDPSLWPECKRTACTQDSHYQLSTLLRQLGDDFDATYGEPGSTSVTVPFLYSPIQKYNYSYHSFTSYIRRAVEYHLNYKGPVLMIGDYEGKHMWICDGMLTKQEDDKQIKYFHYNWGWDGEFNGFFRSGVFAPAEGYPDFTQIQIGCTNPEK